MHRAQTAPPTKDVSCGRATPPTPSLPPSVFKSIQTMRSDGIKSFAFLCLFFLSAAATNFTQCLVNFRDSNATEGGTNYFGDPVTDPKDAVALTYNACIDWCGRGWETFHWSVFSQQFSAWLLPWLALISQLPFGAESKLDNLISGGFPPTRVDASYRFSYHHTPVFLTVGSPTLAAYSLAITALNTRWTYNRFSTIKYPNSRKAARALVFLQQVPLRLKTRGGFLASLVVLSENDAWWECLVDRLEQTHTWTIAATTSVIWVVVAFAFTIIDSLMNLGEDVNSNGQGVGSLWLWLIPIIVGSLWVPVSSYDKLRAAIKKANELAFVAARDGLPQIKDPLNFDTPMRVSASHERAIRMCKKGKVFTKDATRAAPVFNYSRIWEWSSVVDMIARAFEQADRNGKRHKPADSGKEWVPREDKHLRYHRDNRTGTLAQLQVYCGFSLHENKEPIQPVPSGMWERIFLASIVALGLQWGTTASAAIVVVFTPTAGLGCRSGSYILYGIVSTMIWLALLLSSYLAHYAKVRHNGDVAAGSGFNSANLAKSLATFLRRLSTLVACCNALFVILVCVSQFSNFYSTCYCNSSVLGRGSQRAYNIIAAGYDYDHTKAAWIGGVVLAGGCVVLFLFFLHLALEPFSGRGDH